VHDPAQEVNVINGQPEYLALAQAEPGAEVAQLARPALGNCRRALLGSGVAGIR
jgi:hypothetical protein